MGQGLLAEPQGDVPLTEIVTGDDGPIGSDFSQQVIPFLLSGRWTCSRFSGPVGRSRYRDPHGRFSIVQPAFDRRVPAPHAQGPGIRQAYARPSAHHLHTEKFKPSAHHPIFTPPPPP